MLLAQRTAYCLRAVDVIEAAGKRGHAPLHRISTGADGFRRPPVARLTPSPGCGQARRPDAASDSA
jgi:hypothetical protein